MNNLTTQDSLLQHIRENLIGSSNLSLNGIASCCDVAKSSLSEALNSSVREQPHKLAQKLMDKGIDPVRLIKNGFDAKATWLVIEYFAYESKAEALGAKQIARTFGTIGILTTFEKLSETPQTQLPPKRDIIEYANIIPILQTVENPMLRSILEQRFMEEVSSTSLSLNKSESETCVLTVRAKYLGFSDKEIGNGSALGKYVATKIESLGKQWHGRYEVNTYKVTKELDQCIRDYFAQKISKWF